MSPLSLQILPHPHRHDARKQFDPLGVPLGRVFQWELMDVELHPTVAVGATELDKPHGYALSFDDDWLID